MSIRHIIFFASFALVLSTTTASAQTSEHASSKNKSSEHASSRDKGANKIASQSNGESGIQPVNLNTADEAQLVTLPGIGPSKAKAIIALRQKRKGFRKVHEILRVRGIGRKTLRKLMPYLSIETNNGQTQKKP